MYLEDLNANRRFWSQAAYEKDRRPVFQGIWHANTSNIELKYNEKFLVSKTSSKTDASIRNPRLRQVNGIWISASVMCWTAGIESDGVIICVIVIRLAIT